LHPIGQEILSHYFKPENNPDFLLPVLCKGDSPLMVKRKALQAIKTTNEYLYRIAKDAKIRQDITTYYARYSWANICKGLGYSKDLIAEALGHSYGNAVTGIYLDNYGNEVIDAANKSVIEAVFN
jgi:integrase